MSTGYDNTETYNMMIMNNLRVGSFSDLSLPKISHIVWTSLTRHQTAQNCLTSGYVSEQIATLQGIFLQKIGITTGSV